MNNKTRRHATPMEKALNFVIFIIIAAVLGVGIYAVYAKLAPTWETSKIDSGEKEKNVQYLATKANLSVDDYLDQYGLRGNNEVNKNTTENDMVNHMTLENYAKYKSTDLNTLLSQMQLTDKATGDTLFTDAQNMMPVSAAIGGEQQFEMLKTDGGLDDSVTADTPWGEAKDKVEAAIKVYQEKHKNDTPAPTAETSAAPAEGASTAESSAAQAPAAAGTSGSASSGTTESTGSSK